MWDFYNGFLLHLLVLEFVQMFPSQLSSTDVYGPTSQIVWGGMEGEIPSTRGFILLLKAHSQVVGWDPSLPVSCVVGIS